MPRKQYQYHYIYKTTNILNNKFYIGMHSTNNLNDGYQGSGKRLWYSINKHGKENHKTEILEYLPDRESLRLREAEIVNKELINEDLCMNLAVGGQGINGSWKYANANGKNLYGKNGTAGYGLENLLQGEELKKRLIEKGKWEEYLTTQANKFKKYFDNGGKYGFQDKKHAAETKRTIGAKNAIHQKGIKNSQYGTCWIYSLSEQLCKKVKVKELNDYIKKGWNKGRKFFN